MKFPEPRDPALLEPRQGAAILLAKAHRERGCTRCVLSRNNPGNACFWGDGPVPADGMVIYEQPAYWDWENDRPLVGQAGAYVDTILRLADLDRRDLYLTSVIKCKASDADSRAERLTAMQQCAPYLQAEIAAVQPKVILAMGVAALYFFTRQQAGIQTMRGEAQIWPHAGDPWVIFTISPQQVLHSPAFDGPFAADVFKFKRYLDGQITPPAVETVLVKTYAEFNAVLMELWLAPEKLLTFDLETRGFVAHKPEYSKVWCAAMTRGLPAGRPRSFLLPLEHPDSPFIDAAGRCDPAVVREVVRLIAHGRVSGHNVLFDLHHAHYLASRYGIDTGLLAAAPEYLPEGAHERTDRPIGYGRPDPVKFPPKQPKRVGAGTGRGRAKPGSAGDRGAAAADRGAGTGAAEQSALPLDAAVRGGPDGAAGDATATAAGEVDDRQGTGEVG